MGKITNTTTSISTTILSFLLLLFPSNPNSKPYFLPSPLSLSPFSFSFYIYLSVYIYLLNQTHFAPSIIPLSLSGLYFLFSLSLSHKRVSTSLFSDPFPSIAIPQLVLCDLVASCGVDDFPPFDI